MSYPNTLAVYEVENNGNDYNGSYNCTNVGTPTYSSVTKHDGSYSLVAPGATNLLKAPVGLENAVGALASYSIEFWSYVHSIGASGYAIQFQKKGDVNTAGGIWFNLCSAAGYYGKGLFLKWNGNHDLVKSDAFDIATEADTWIHWALTYVVASDTLKIYKNNSLIWTLNPGFGNPFSTNDGNFGIGGSGQFTFTFSGYVDNFIVSNTAKTSFPTVSVSSPTISSVTENTGFITGGDSRTITGTQFAAGATVTFGGVVATNVIVVSDTEITCTTPAHAAGAVDVVVTNTDTGTVTATNAYTYETVSVSACSPSSGSVLGSTSVTLTGEYFSKGTASVTFDGVAATSVVVASDTSITCLTPSHVAGAVDVVVTISA